MRIPSARLTLPVLVWAVLYATHAFLGYYHDDYAYAGLTYSEGVDKLMTSRHLCAIRLHERKTAMP